MSFSLDQNFINQFNANVHMLLSEKGAKLYGLFEESNGAPGELHMFDRFADSGGLNVITNRGDLIVASDGNHSRRVAQREFYYKAFNIYEMDKAKLIIDPASTYVEESVRAHGVNYDRVIINALLGSAATGKAGAGSTALGAGQVIAAGGTGLTVAKLDQAIRLLETAHVDVEAEDMYLLVPGHGVEDLVGDSSNRLTSFDFMESKTLAGKTLPMFRGVKMVRTQLLPQVTSGSVGRAILCTRKAAKVAVWDRFKSSMDRLVNVANQPMQLYTESSIGAVRMEEGLVVDIQFTL